MSNRLTKAELDAVLTMAGDCDAGATIDSCYIEQERDAAIEAFESGMDKLRRQLARRSA